MYSKDIRLREKFKKKKIEMWSCSTHLPILPYTGHNKHFTLTELTLSIDFQYVDNYIYVIL